MQEIDQTEVVETEELIDETQVETQEEAPKSAEYNWEEFRQLAKSQKYEIEAQREQIESLNRKIEEAQKPKEEDVDEWEGFEPDDYVKVEHVKRSTSEVKKLKKELQGMQARLQQTEVERQESVARGKYDDYDQVIEKFGIPMIKQNPALAQALKAMPNWAEMAYEMAKATPEYKSAQSSMTSKDADKVIKNTQRPTSINAAPNSVKKQVDVFSSLSPAEVWKKSQEFARQA